jgi:hypothetical protein
MWRIGIQQTHSTATAQNQSLVTREIRYRLPGASQVSLVWGINKWAIVPKKLQPAGTMIVDKVMHTPMVRRGDVFRVRVRVPANTTLNYGFLTTKSRSGADVKIWERYSDYSVAEAKDGIIEAQAPSSVTRQLSGQRRSTNNSDMQSPRISVSSIIRNAWFWLLSWEEPNTQVPETSPPPSTQTPSLVTQADSTSAPTVTRAIHYIVPEASEVTLVWGIDGWAAIPEHLRSADTYVKDGVMRTPMVLEADAFVAKVQMPAGTVLNYGFLTTKSRRGTDAKVWDEQADHSVTAEQHGTLEAQAPDSVTERIRRTDRMYIDLLGTRVSWSVFRLVLGICAVLVVVVARTCFPRVRRAQRRYGEQPWHT